MILKHEVSNYFVNTVKTYIYNHLINQLVNQSTIFVILKKIEFLHYSIVNLQSSIYIRRSRIKSIFR